MLPVLCDTQQTSASTYVCCKAGSKKSGTEQNHSNQITYFSEKWTSIDSMPNFVYFPKFNSAENKEDYFNI